MDALFEKRMKELLGPESAKWEESLSLPLYQGVRISGQKQPVEETEKRLCFLEKPSPFAADTWYYHGHYGLHPAHVQGLIYFQEPSAGTAVEVLDVQPDDLVLDLCAAPGSKSTQIAEKLKSGFLLSNEYDGRRARVLYSNLERMGAENVMVTNMDTGLLCPQVEGAFDRVLVDAPCSGEGMMKKHDAARDEWSIANVLLCAARQKDILKNAWKALRPGGVLVYSTCTYAPEENEYNAAWLLETFEDAELDPIDVPWGRPGLSVKGLDESKVRRIFPMDGGEGHFIARFRKKEDGSSKAGSLKYEKNEKPDEQAAAFLKKMLPEGFAYYHTMRDGDEVRLFGMNHPFVRLKKGTVIAQGVWIGTTIKKRFEPAHSFFLSQSAARQGLGRTETTLEEMDAFCHGQQLSRKEERGWRMLCYQNIPYGFGKSDGTRITSRYPKGLRLAPASHLLSEDEIHE